MIEIIDKDAKVPTRAARECLLQLSVELFTFLALLHGLTKFKLAPGTYLPIYLPSPRYPNKSENNKQFRV